MRWSIVRLIWARELRDQLRDRRTVGMIVGLPILLYPLLGFAVLRFAEAFLSRPSIVAIKCQPGLSEDFPQAELHHAPDLGWLSLLPDLPVPGISRLCGVLCLVEAGHQVLDFPLLMQDGKLAPAYQESATALKVQVRPVGPGDARDLLSEKSVDLLLLAPADFLARLAKGEQPALTLKGRPNDDHSRQAAVRMTALLDAWRRDLKNVRLARLGLPGSFDEVFEIKDEGGASSTTDGGGKSLLDIILHVFPFMLVMWSLAGALYPAVDLCAGEKERGTMETLLISPASRQEIVLGKFLTIWVFSAVTSLLNLASMGITTWTMGPSLPQGSISLAALLWCVLLLLPLSAFFSAICLAVGAYARSTKEGQYYLMPLFLIAMPLIFLTLAPGVELNEVYSMVPVTGVGLLMQRLITSPSLDQVPWFYFVPVLASVVLYSWLALRWAIQQFQREEVLFREAERLDLGLWLRRLFREKEAAPTTGQAMFCFGLLLLLRWLSLDLGVASGLPVRTSVIQLAFVAAPPLFMALMVTKRPITNLGLRLPRMPYLLAALLLLPLAELVQNALAAVPDLSDLWKDRRLDDLPGVPKGLLGIRRLIYLAILSGLPAVCEELAFRGLILTGLRHRFRLGPAVLLSAFLFAVYHSNVFAAGPLFVLGVVLALLSALSGSIWPGVLLHAGCRVVVLNGSLILPAPSGVPSLPDTRLLWLCLAAVICTGLAAVLLWRRRPRRQEPAP
jgi:sodium transport system permease protein